MRENAPELRNIHSAQLQEEVHKGWETQRSERGEEREAAQKQKLEYVVIVISIFSTNNLHFLILDSRIIGTEVLHSGKDC